MIWSIANHYFIIIMIITGCCSSMMMYIWWDVTLRTEPIKLYVVVWDIPLTLHNTCSAVPQQTWRTAPPSPPSLYFLSAWDQPIGITSSASSQPIASRSSLLENMSPLKLCVPGESHKFELRTAQVGFKPHFRLLFSALVLACTDYTSPRCPIVKLHYNVTL